MKKNKFFILIIIVVVIVLVLGIFISNNKNNKTRYSNQIPNDKIETQTADKGYSITEVAIHNNSSSCWSVVNGGVYDLTNFISKHPGGAKSINKICGVDGSSEFNDQHGGDKDPLSVLSSLKIGTLK